MLSCGYETSDEEKAGSDSDGSPQEDSEDSEELSAWEKELAVKALDKRLRKLSYLRTNHAIHKYFRQYARAETSDGSKAVTPAQVVQMAPEVARYLEVPDAAFSQVYQICQRFDFDGGGALNKKQCTAMFRTILRQKRKEWGGTKLAGDVPYRGLREAGYTVDRELGRGGQGVMYLCTFGDSERYCVKFYSKEDGDQDELETIMTEYALMTELSHPNIAKTYEVFQDSKFFYLVNEPYFGGDLTKVAKRAHDQSVWMGENWFRGIFRQCLEGLQFLHSQAVMHCDIKEENIMVVASDLEYPRIVLIDFGLAIAFSSAPDGCAGTPGYIPPETWTTSWWYPRGDIFSLGITIFQMMIGQVPNDDVLGILQTEGEREEDKAAGLALQLPWKRFRSSMRELEELVAGMVHRDMTCRPSATAALNHAWFTTSDNDEGLPAETISALVGSSAAECLREQVVYELAFKNNLKELRCLYAELQEMDGNNRGKVPKEVALPLFARHNVRAGSAHAYAEHTADANGEVEYLSVAKEILKIKERYTVQFLQDLFQELDTDSQGRLSTVQVRQLLSSSAVECDGDDMEEIFDEVPFDGEGFVSFRTFRDTMLADGRIARRSRVEQYICAPECPMLCTTM